MLSFLDRIDASRRRAQSTKRQEWKRLLVKALASDDLTDAESVKLDDLHTELEPGKDLGAMVRDLHAHADLLAPAELREAEEAAEKLQREKWARDAELTRIDGEYRKKAAPFREANEKTEAAMRAANKVLASKQEKRGEQVAIEARYPQFFNSTK